MDLWSPIVAFITGAGTVIVTQLAGAWRESKIDTARRKDDRKIDTGRMEGQTLVGLQQGLNDLRLAMGELHTAMRIDLRPPAELGAYDKAWRAVRLYGARTLKAELREASDSATRLASNVASTSDEAARLELLSDCFQAITAAEVLLGPELRKQIAAGYVKTDRP